MLTMDFHGPWGCQLGSGCGAVGVLFEHIGGCSQIMEAEISSCQAAEVGIYSLVSYNLAILSDLIRSGAPPQHSGGTLLAT